MTSPQIITVIILPLLLGWNKTASSARKTLSQKTNGQASFHCQLSDSAKGRAGFGGSPHDIAAAEVSSNHCCHWNLKGLNSNKAGELHSRGGHLLFKFAQSWRGSPPGLLPGLAGVHRSQRVLHEGHQQQSHQQQWRHHHHFCSPSFAAATVKRCVVACAS